MDNIQTFTIKIHNVENHNLFLIVKLRWQSLYQSCELLTNKNHILTVKFAGEKLRIFYFSIKSSTVTDFL